MNIEERLAAIEERLAEQEGKRKIIRNELLALQFLLLKLLPVISTAPRDEIGQASELAQDHAKVVLTALQYSEDDVINVLSSIHELRSELLGDSDYDQQGALH